jgi:16S rRNA (guanine1516-N2)-methyltransferase
MHNDQVSIRCDKFSVELATKLAKDLNAEIIDADQQVQTEYLIDIIFGRLSLQVVSQPLLKPLSLDFNCARKNKGKDPLLRAIGSSSRYVVDATAGWCRDAVHMAHSGLTVIAIEQNKIVMSLVCNALENLTDMTVRRRLTLLQGDSISMLGKFVNFPDVVYLDPMYPESPKSAATKKHLTVLRKLAGDQNDNLALFNIAMQVAQQRVVIKRPHYSEPLAPGKVGQTQTKLVRFDIYKPYNCQ